MTQRLTDAMKEHRHLPRFASMCKDNGEPLTRQSAWRRVRRAARAAEVPRGVHILSHTFFSHLAMQGAPGKAIQELAGHRRTVSHTGYMHLSPACLVGDSVCWSPPKYAPVVETLWRRHSRPR